MREIIFRAKRKDNGEWVYGSLLIQAGERINKDELTPVEYRILGCRGENHLVAPKTVGQFTGLKDKNGKKVFEGDIVKMSYRGDVLTAVVRFGNYNQPDKILKTHLGFYFDFDTVNFEDFRKDVGYWTGRTFGEIEVIGNVHDNLELLNK